MDELAAQHPLDAALANALDEADIEAQDALRVLANVPPSLRSSYENWQSAGVPKKKIKINKIQRDI